MGPKLNPSTARQAELAIRILALLCGALGAPVLVLTAVATGHPLFALGSIAASGPLAVARLIAPPRECASGTIPPSSVMTMRETAETADWRVQVCVDEDPLSTH
jgi:hypothetical protein